MVESKGSSELSSTSQDGPMLKQLPEHLRYAFFGENLTFPVIVSASLNQDENDKLLGALRRHKSIIGWSISDIKGTSRTFCMHKILIDESYKPILKHQRRLNPAMKEVVRAKVL